MSKPHSRPSSSETSLAEARLKLFAELQEIEYDFWGFNNFAEMHTIPEDFDLLDENGEYSEHLGCQKTHPSKTSDLNSKSNKPAQ